MRSFNITDLTDRKRMRIIRGMFGGDPSIGTPEREAERLHTSDPNSSPSYMHVSDMPEPLKPLKPYMSFGQFGRKNKKDDE